MAAVVRTGARGNRRDSCWLELVHPMPGIARRPRDRMRVYSLADLPPRETADRLEATVGTVPMGPGRHSDTSAMSPQQPRDRRFCFRCPAGGAEARAGSRRSPNVAGAVRSRAGSSRAALSRTRGMATLRAVWAHSRWTAMSPIGGVEPRGRWALVNAPAATVHRGGTRAVGSPAAARQRRSEIKR